MAYAEVSNKAVTLKADLDGDGTEDSVIIDRKTVSVGDSRVKHLGEGQEIEVAIVDVQKNDRRKEVLVRRYDSEDHYEHQLVAIDKGKVVISKNTIGAGGLEFPGDGMIVERSSNCGQNYWSEHKFDGTQFRETKNVTIGKMKPDECAACPFVYVNVDGEPRYVGEILRNIRGESMATTQPLRIPSLDGRPHSEIIVSEEKDEVTYLDHIEVETAGGRLSPTVCTTDGALPAYCVKDGVHHQLTKGEKLSLRFEVNERTGRILHVWASGYYVPQTTL